MSQTNLKEDVNTVGGGAIAGAGVGPQGEPGVKSSKSKTLNLILAAMLKRVQPLET